MTAPNSDLASVLQTLQAYAPQPQPIPSIPQDPESEYDPSQYDPSLSLALQSHNHSQQPQASHHHFADANPPPPHTTNAPPPEQPKPTTPKPPPSTKSVTTYAAALRHITTHLLSSPNFIPRINHLIQTQHTHERQWFTGRETLVKQLQNRDASRKKLDEVLASVGGRPATPSGGDASTGELSKEEELRVYDRKVWRAQKEMIGAAEKELERLGVPFFGEGEGRKFEGKEEEGRELKGKIVGLLEDLCGGDDGDAARKCG